MKYCTKCGEPLVEGSKFCNYCGSPVKFIDNNGNPYANNQPVAEINPIPSCTNQPKTEEELKAEEQALLNKFSIGLKHERMAWKFAGIFFLIATIVMFAGAIFIGIGAIALDDFSGELSYIYSSMAFVYFVMALAYLPITIINMCMKNKLEDYREKLYTDCKDGIGHYSVGSIVFAAFFNTIAMVFIIVYFVQAKNNATVIERIKSKQDSFNLHN